MDDEFLNYLLGNETSRKKFTYNFGEERNSELMKKLDEIETMIRQLVKAVPYDERKNNSPTVLCEQILRNEYVIVESEKVNKNLHPLLFILSLDDNKVLVSFKDTIDLLQLLFEKYGDKIEDKLPKRLLPLFLLLRKMGLIYFDHESKSYKFIK
ncbi:hypothetical protein [Stygiolobus caldivivus]|uniref:Uncharacterized protein n=1 Tax=Stygiolobus caldivivus TaxID=2824673 RepID=A0A8D5U4C9_9CREN|nr:hypothetical protein [Stygiolobus caldivivus]BCU69027.1 hypothetical protein KN1_03240 [Stygiolobus caldivivus]